MNTLSNLDTYFIPNTLDGINVIDETISDTAGASLHIDGTNKMLADIDVNLHQIKNLANGTTTNDAVNYSQLSAKADTAYVNSQDNLKLNLTGGTITGIINQSIGGNNIQYGGSNIIHANSNTVENVAIGYQTLKEGGGNFCYNNTAIGNGALNNVYFASRYNTAIGHSAGYQAIGGDYNIYMGYQAGINSYNDLGCYYLGCFSGRDDPNPAARLGYIKSMAIGAEVIVNGSNQIRIGTATETTIFDGSVVIQTPTVGNHPTTKTYVDDGLNLKANITDMNTADNLKLNKAGDTMTGVLTLNGGTVTKSTVDASNLTNTYINFGEAGATSDWAYLRQIGGSNDIKLSLDFHDDLNDGKFSLRSIQSTATPDTINEFFYASPTKTKIGSYLDMSLNKITNVADGGTATNDAVNYGQLILKADKTYVDSSLNLKANTTYVDSSLNLKANTTYVDASLNLKADTTYVNFQDALKLNLTGGTMTGPLNLAPNVSNNICPPGAVMYFIMTTPPSGWLKADGQAVSRTTYSNLYAIIGTAWGAGDGTTTFNVPNLMGNFIRCLNDTATGTDANRTLSSIPQPFMTQTHTHTVTEQGYKIGAFQTNGLSLEGTGGTLGNATTYTTSGNSGNSGSETRPINIALMTCIKY